MRHTVCRWFVTSRLIAGLMVAAVCTAQAHTRPHYGGTLHVETQGDPWQTADSIGRRLVFDSLVRTDESGAVLPALAVRWQSQSGDHRWQFWLRPGVHFHDGSPLTADSVLQSLTRSCTHCPWSAIRTAGDSDCAFTTGLTTTRRLPARALSQPLCNQPAGCLRQSIRDRGISICVAEQRSIDTDSRRRCMAGTSVPECG